MRERFPKPILKAGVQRRLPRPFLQSQSYSLDSSRYRKRRRLSPPPQSSKSAIFSSDAAAYIRRGAFSRGLTPALRGFRQLMNRAREPRSCDSARCVLSPPAREPCPLTAVPRSCAAFPALSRLPAMPQAAILRFRAALPAISRLPATARPHCFIRSPAPSWHRPPSRSRRYSRPPPGCTPARSARQPAWSSCGY